MKFKLLFWAILFSPFVVFSQKKANADIMKMGDGIYFITKHGTTGYSSKSRLRKKALDEANEFASQNEATVEVVSVEEISVKLGSVPRVELKFRLVKNSEKTDNKINATNNDDNSQKTDGQIILKNTIQQDEKDKFEKLEKIGKLFKDGILSKEEFETEKKKILSGN
jgi:hypothetical protein